jgi:hypothetical protein
MSTVPDSQQDTALAALREQLEDLIGRCYVADDPHGACDETMQLIDRYSSERADREKAKAVREAQIGWTVELPDLPNFQIVAFDGNRTEWVTPMFDTNDLPLIVRASLTSGEDTE